MNKVTKISAALCIGAAAFVCTTNLQASKTVEPHVNIMETAAVQSSREYLATNTQWTDEAVSDWCMEYINYDEDLAGSVDAVLPNGEAVVC